GSAAQTWYVGFQSHSWAKRILRCSLDEPRSVDLTRTGSGAGGSLRTFVVCQNRNGNGPTGATANRAPPSFSCGSSLPSPSTAPASPSKAVGGGTEYVSPSTLASARRKWPTLPR